MDTKKGAAQEIDNALLSPEVPKIYANGFSNALGTGDVIILFKNGEAPTAVVNLSYTIAKTLAVKIGSMISALEEATGNTIMVSEQINIAMSERTKK